jgi:hypothetical protein
VQKTLSLIFVLILIIALLAACARPVNDENLTAAACPTTPTLYYVRTDGNNTNAGTSNSSGGAWRNINYAVNFSCLKAGDAIKVQPGRYNETVTITKSGTAQNRITLMSANTHQAVIAYTGITKNVGRYAAILLRPENPDSTDPSKAYIVGWTISGFRIEGGTDTSKKATTAPVNKGPGAQGIPYIFDGIAVRKGRNITISGNSIYRTGASGIAVRHSFSSSTRCPASPNKSSTSCAVQNSGITIANNTIDTPNVGVFLDNKIVLDQEALTLDGVYNFEVYNNTILNRMKQGIDVKVGGHDGSIHDNTVTGPNQIAGGAAIYIDGQRAPTYNIDIYRNKLYNGRSNGITISTEHPSYNSSGASSLSGTVVDCSASRPCSATTTGIIDVHHIRIFNNLVYNNGDATFLGRGLTIDSQVRNVEIYHNTFAKNYKNFQFGNNYGGYYAKDITLRNNIFSNPGAGGIGYIYDVGNIALENNLFTGWDVYRVGASGSAVTPSTRKCMTNAVGICAGTGKDAYNKLTTGTIFINVSGNNFQLITSSPARNMGTTGVSGATTDYTGLSRPQPSGSRHDVGAYEATN